MLKNARSLGLFGPDLLTRTQDCQEARRTSAATGRACLGVGPAWGGVACLGGRGHGGLPAAPDAVMPRRRVTRDPASSAALQ